MRTILNLLANRTLKRSSSGFVRLTRSLRVTSKSSLWLLWSLEHMCDKPSIIEMGNLGLDKQTKKFQQQQKTPEDRNKVAPENAKWPKSPTHAMIFIVSPVCNTCTSASELFKSDLSQHPVSRLSISYPCQQVCTWETGSSPWHTQHSQVQAGTSPHQISPG